MQEAQGQCIFVIPENIALEWYSVFHSSRLRLSALVPFSLKEMFSAVHVRAYIVDTFRVEGNLFYVEQGCLKRGSHVLSEENNMEVVFTALRLTGYSVLKDFPNEGD